MKKAVAISIGLLIGYLNGTLHCMDEKKPIFIVAKQGEDLNAYKKIFTDVYLGYANQGDEEDMRNAIESSFPLLVSWIGQKGKRFIKILDKEEPIGFLTLEELNDPTQIALYSSPILPNYAHWYSCLLECVKKEFPKAKSVSVSCTPKLIKVLEIIKMLGFEQDDSYICDKKLASGYMDLVGYTKALD